MKKPKRPLQALKHSGVPATYQENWKNQNHSITDAGRKEAGEASPQTDE